MALGGCFPVTGEVSETSGDIKRSHYNSAVRVLSCQQMAGPQREGDTWQERNMELEAGVKENKRVHRSSR